MSNRLARRPVRPGHSMPLGERAMLAPMRLEEAAKRIERNLSRSMRCRDPQTTEWVGERAAGAAIALHTMKRHIIAPTPDSWNRLIAVLRHDTAALASGNLGLMQWMPPPPAVRRRSMLRTAVTVAQRVIVAIVPVVAVFALQPVLRLSGSDLVLARGGAIFWAVFYLILTLDPALVS